MPKMNTYLVFERTANDTIPPPPVMDTRPAVSGDPHLSRQARAEFDRAMTAWERLNASRGLLGYVCVGGIAAKSADEAAMAAVRATRRVSKFAVIEAEFFDFTEDAASEPDAQRPQLNA